MTCISEVEEGEWSTCDSLCTRERVNTCKCIDPRTRFRTTVNDRICDLDQVGGRDREECETRVEHQPWSDCDGNCEQKRDSVCTCDDPRGGSNPVTESLCNLLEDASQTRLCATGQLFLFLSPI